METAQLQGTLLATKLHVPRPRPGFVVRPRLAQRLDEGLARGLTLVCAPAGSGKTSLLAEWVWSGPGGVGARPVAWISLDPGDNDPARFWRHVVAALDRIRPGIAGRVGLPSPEPPSPDVLVSALINELSADDDAAGAPEVVLVVDDYHLIDSAQVHESVAFLLANLPPGLRVLLASRSEPPLPLARLRARGQVAEVGAAELRFTAGEAAALLRDALGRGLPSETVAALTARTEGWAAGLQLAALSLRGQSDAARFVAEFGGSNRYVLDYLTQEVLDRQPGDVREFLLETCVLETLSGELCDAVTGRTGSQALLEAIERAGLFLIPLDEVRGWWRYHHLFADLLRARLRQERPDRVAALHRAASAWHSKHGLADDAIRHAVAAGDDTEAARLIERYFDEAFLTGERATIQRWLSAIPAELARTRPRLRLAQVLAALVYGDVEAAAVLLNVEPADGAEPFEPSVGGAASLLVNVPAGFAIGHAWLAYLRGDADTMAEYASRAKARLGDGQRMLESIYQLNLALADWLRGALPAAERGFASLITRWRSVGERSMAARSYSYLGQVQRDQGRLDGAFRTYQQLVEIAEGTEGMGRPDRRGAQPLLPVAGYGYMGMAEVAYQRDNLDDAMRYVTEGITRCRRLSESQPLASGLATLAWIRQAEGDAVAAVAAMDEAERAVPSAAVANLLNPVPAQRARLLLAQGNVDAAARWTAERGLGPDDQPTYLREQEYAVLARLLIAQGVPGRALPLLGRLHATAAGQGRTGSVIELLVLRALALKASGDEQGAATTLAEAVALGRPRGYVRVFADAGVAGVNSRSVDGRDVDGRGVVGQPLADPLTARELEVLALLAAGAPNQGIAEQLFVTLDTVKKHVSHVLAKLGAANRTEAVTRARQIGLIG